MPSTLEKRDNGVQNAIEQEQPSGGFWRTSWKRAAVWALIIFSVINAGLWRLESNKRSADLWHGTGSIDLTVNDFNNTKQKPNIVLLGSSLMMFPFWSMDKAYDPVTTSDIFHHHGARVFENKIKEVGGFNDPHIFSFAIFGQMVSDAFIYVNEFLSKERAPEFLIYGIAPRDFSDHDLSSPMATNTFKRLVNLDNLAPYASLYLPGFQDKIEFVMSRLCYFYKNRSRIQQEFGKGVEVAYIATGVHEKEKKLDFSNAGFMMFGGMKDRWDSSEKEYTRRYKDIAERDLSMQMGFLQRLLQVARERNIKVVLINMPLSDTNRNLLPPGFYSRFRQEIAAAANQPGVKLVDIGDSAEFNHFDFWDTAHLGPTGGQKVLAHVIPAMRELQNQAPAQTSKQ